MPIGPFCRPDFVADSLESIRRYTAEDTRIVLLDSSQKGTGDSLAYRYGAEVCTLDRTGLFGGLYMNLSAGFEIALEKPFDVLLRIDTDALVAASGFAETAHQYFLEHRDVGSVGSYRIAYDGGQRSNSWAARHLLLSIAPWKPRTAADVVKLLFQAKRNGYRLGEAIMGGVCMYSARAIETLSSTNLLGRRAIARCRVQEDHIFSLLLAVGGLKLADFGDGSNTLPFGVKHVGLPASPAELIQKRKALIHSTKSWRNMTEQAIRDQFAAARSRAG
jgi:hypothetical protein